MKVPPSWVWLKLHTDEGAYGLGEPYLEGHPEAVIAEVRRLEAVLVGEDPGRVGYLWDRMYRACGSRGGAGTMGAVGGIDIALGDVAGKLAGLPIHRMLGGAVRDRIKMYHATGGGPPHSVEPGLPYRAGQVGRGAGSRRRADPAAYAEGARVLVQEWGFRALKAHL